MSKETATKKVEQLCREEGEILDDITPLLDELQVLYDAQAFQSYTRVAIKVILGYQDALKKSSAINKTLLGEYQ